MLLLSILIGVLATCIADALSFITKQIWGIPSPNFVLLGRWLLYMPQRQFTHRNIMQSPTRSFETCIGWFMHYVTGVVFAYVLLMSISLNLFNLNDYAFAILFGIGTVICPFFIMQPSLGFGVAASKTPNKLVARLRSLLTHCYFGMGLALSLYITQ